LLIVLVVVGYPLLVVLMINPMLLVILTINPMSLVVIECCSLWLTVVDCIDHQSNIVVGCLCLSVVGGIDNQFNVAGCPLLVVLMINPTLLLVVLMINPTLLLVVVDLFCCIYTMYCSIIQPILTLRDTRKCWYSKSNCLESGVKLGNKLSKTFILF
jgi:hypothetical protein